jgi:hypothetical protein
MSGHVDTREARSRASVSAPRYRYNIWHHPRVFRSSHQTGWAWECGCGSSSHEAHPGSQRAAALAAIAHVHSQAAGR